MCCFSRHVVSVSQTNIFARPSKKERQYIVYSMNLSAKEDLAMILPIPTPPKSDEDSVKFISLKEYENFFADLEKGFPVPEIPPPKVERSSIAPAGAKPLKVVEVGSFEASFVPSIDDFSRLDERFRLPAGVWDKLPAYKKSGFAVFKLKSGEKKIHPMAFEFPRANAEKIFLPTVHIHDGEVHERAGFDHVLYLQPATTDTLLPEGWEESTQPAEMFMNIKKSGDLFNPEMHVYRMKIHGEQKNQDTLV